LDELKRRIFLWEKVRGRDFVMECLDLLRRDTEIAGRLRMYVPFKFVLGPRRDEADHQFVDSSIQFSTKAEFGTKWFYHFEDPRRVQQWDERTDYSFAGSIDKTIRQPSLVFGHLFLTEQAKSFRVLSLVVTRVRVLWGSRDHGEPFSTALRYAECHADSLRLARQAT